MTTVIAIEINTDVLAGSLVSVVCVLGTILMVLVIIASLRIPSMKSPFGTLTINQNIAELVPCLACLFVFFFGYTLNLNIVIDYSYIFGGICIIMLHIVLISFLMISFNRLCAVAFPIAYQTVFGKKWLMILISINWIVPLVASTYLLTFKQCTFAIYHYGWTFSEVKNEVCGAYLTMFRGLQMVPIILTVVTDILTLLLLLILRNRIFKLKSADTKRREMNFAKQVLVQGLVFMIHGVWYEKGRNIMPVMSEHWKIFFTTSFSANLLHVFDPMIVFLCNMDFKTWLAALGKKKQLRKVTTVTGISSLT
ncbi:G-protein coupled receptors family 1 profile domain-containing protein [Caenorhabditis elegans]|uniref:G-protein coupled receptors family 1 profile domain-containing protein n=1 Tax=Caenorhabditis elegans TaxID=6239 RepID=Q17710_CAEEL|nr:G-protein coupled receptors family 1 profile domain-containing protein [Caenorhabditis elegans]CAB01120.2 G-protein coupled receptors family 1 profile domain-containing protein [Caenorhabditis elegans]|eukprot:NP_506455.2 Serpentine Receptor, class X [Caenorhabditis elegans]